MADEELAPEGEALELAPEEQQEEEQRELTASELAAQMGWRPKDQWQGDPEAWKPADKFILDGRDITQSLSRELKSVRQELGTIGQTSAQILADKMAEKEAEWQRRYDEAFDSGDKETANALLNQRPAGQVVTKAPDPTVQQWVAKNTWFNEDPYAHARAQEISDRLKHLPVPEQLSQVERAIRKEFPEHFPTVKPPAATQTAATRNANPSNRVKGFADMPEASRQTAIEFERLNGVPKEDFAKQYWANEAKKGSRA